MKTFAKIASSAISGAMLFGSQGLLACIARQSQAVGFDPTEILLIDRSASLVPTDVGTPWPLGLTAFSSADSSLHI